MSVDNPHVVGGKQTIKNIEFTCIQTGQSKPYGNHTYVYSFMSDSPFSFLESICRNKVRECSLRKSDYITDNQSLGPSMNLHMRTHYELKKLDDEGNYEYTVTTPFTD